MGKTIQVAADRESDQTKTVLPAEVARGVYIRNPPTAQALKLMHLLISIAGGRMASDIQHEFRLSEIRKIPGMKNHDRASLEPLIADLAAVVLVTTTRKSSGSRSAELWTRGRLTTATRSAATCW